MPEGVIIVVKRRMNMQLVVDKIAKAFGIHEIFKDVSFMVEQGEHKLIKIIVKVNIKII